MTHGNERVADVVVAAAGSSARMGFDKLRVDIAGRPLLAWTLERLAAARSVRRLVVVAAPGAVAALASEPWVRAVDARVVPGGTRRQDSVEAGLSATDADVVLVHDGARPFVTPQLVDRVAAATLEHGAAVPVAPVVDTLKEVIDGRINRTVDRERLASAQTPQGSRRDLLLAAYAAQRDGAATHTDEASLLQAHGIPVVAVAGDTANVKVTLPEDVERAAALLGRTTASRRVGHGSDSHPFGPGDGLALGGIVLPDAPRLHGHSDGDVVLHAIADGLLGAACLGDLGRVFPAGDPATRGIESERLLAEVVARAGDAGWHPEAVDVTIVAGRPRLGGRRLDAMRSAIARSLGIRDADVSVKASSGNLSGDDGAGRAISAHAIVTAARR